MKASLTACLLSAVVFSGCTSATPERAEVRDSPNPPPRVVSNAPEAALPAQEAAIVESSRSSGMAPAEFRQRTELDNCGELKMMSVAGRSPWDFDCLVPSDGSQSAELVLLRRTVEGDPIVTYYRVGPGIDGIEVFGDNSLDRFGSKDWNHHRYTVDELAELGM